MRPAELLRAEFKLTHLPAIAVGLLSVAFALVVALPQPRAFAQPGSATISAIPTAQNAGNVIELPAKQLPNAPPFSTRSGLRVRVDTRWCTHLGYRPIEVAVESPAPTKADQLITMRLQTGWQSHIAVEQSFVMPAGATSATSTFLMPFFQREWTWALSWDFRINGVRDKELSVNRGSNLGWTGTSNSFGQISILTSGPKSIHRAIHSTAGAELEVLTLDPASFPTRWVEYSSLDVVSISLDELKKLKQDRPAVWDAITRWVHSGGQLWVWLGDSGKNWDSLTELSSILEMPSPLLPAAGELDRQFANTPIDEDASANNSNPPQTAEKPDAPVTEPKGPPGTREADSNDSPATDSNQETNDKADENTLPNEKAPQDDVPPMSEGWRPLAYRAFNPDGRINTYLNQLTGQRQIARGQAEIERLERNPNFTLLEQKTEPDDIRWTRRPRQDTRAWFVEQPLGLGWVRAFHGPNQPARFASSPAISVPAGVTTPSNDGSEAPGPNLERSFAESVQLTQHADTRYGLSPDTANDSFSKWLVPGVGTAPVTEFRVLITLFVLVIGPLNYWLLKRARKLHLIVLSVPAAAILTTLALFAYAVLADGFSNTVRVRSFTKLDQRTGQASCWSWLSYYCGLAPGNGLVLPADVAIYPVLPSWAGDLSWGEEREVLPKGEMVQYRKGWLNSRTPTQYLSIRSRKSPHRIEVLESGDRVRVKNELGENINLLVVLNSEGKFFSTDSIAPGQTLFLEPADRDDAARRFGKLVSANLPQAPSELADNSSDSSFFQRRRRNRFGQSVGSLSLSENLANVAIANLAGLGTEPALHLPPRSYVAVTQRGPEVEIGIPNAIQESSLHVIEGRW